MVFIGQELKRERELRGISLEEMSESTKISLKFLQALEEDRLEVMPSKFFVKALLRTYAQFLGLEEQSLLDKYQITSIFQGETCQVAERPIWGQEETSNKRKRWVTLSVLAACLIILVAWFYFFALKKGTPPQEEPKPSPIIIEETPSSLPTSQPEALAEPAPEEKGLIIEISFIEETWLQVYADSELKLEALKQPGENVVIQAEKELLLNLGNAGGITYSLNSKKGKPFGHSGAVRKNIIINLENYKNFLAEEKESPNNP